MKFCKGEGNFVQIYENFVQIHENFVQTHVNLVRANENVVQKYENRRDVGLLEWGEGGVEDG